MLDDIDDISFSKRRYFLIVPWMSISVYCIPIRDTHITRDMCMGTHIARGYTYHCDRCSFTTEQKLSQCTGEQNYVTKNEKNFDYYYLSNRKMILSKLAGLLFPRKFNKRTSLFTLMRYNSNMVL